MPWYLSPESGGDEPMPEAIAVNGILSDKLIERVNKADKLRVRIVCGTSFSMLNISVDGMPLTVIELDGIQTVPIDVSYVVVNSGQRVSFVLDWDRLPYSMKTSPSILFRVNAIPGMYPSYDPEAPFQGLFASASNSPYNTNWIGRFLFNEIATRNNGNPYYDIMSPPESPSPPPSDTNLLEALPLFPTAIPPPDLSIYYLIEFYEDEAGVNRPHVNGASYPGFNQSSLGKPPLYEYMNEELNEPENEIDIDDNPPVGSWISGDGKTPFILPFNRTIDVIINNTDGGEHPMHLHGHSFWLLGTSEYPYTENPQLRDTVSVPAMGWARIRFVSDNPGVWFLHCHIDWHFEAGLAAYFIEAPHQLKGTINYIPDDHKAACAQFFNAPKTVNAHTHTPTVAPHKATMTASSLVMDSESWSDNCIQQCKSNNPFTK